jgi:hypothetical protein
VESFNDIRAALDYSVDHLTDKGHSFIITIRGSAEAFADHACTMQVVDQNRVFNDGNFGLALHLPFDLKAGCHGSLARFKEMQENASFSDVNYEDGIECYALAFGTDVPAALRMISIVLIKVYGYTVGDSFECKVYDEGAVDIEK